MHGVHLTWHVGKWHLGGRAEASLPTDHGFEVNIGGDHHGGLYHIPTVYVAPWVGRDGSVLPGLEQSRPGEYLTDRLTDEAIGLIRGRRDGRPFFPHLSHYAVHMPIVSPPDLVAKEGGLRVPMVWQWPGRLPAGQVQAPVWQCDIYPTFLEAAGLPPEPQRHADGVSVWRALQDGTPPPRDTLCWHYPCWHYPHYPNQGATPTGAIRQGDWKLIEWFENGRVALYHLPTDVSEGHDLAAAQPELTAALRRRLAAWRQEVGARLSRPNLHYGDILAGRLPRPDGLGRFPPGTPVTR